ncbi:MAG: FxDxF family PEP-CTERM protein [Burkholderiaceae bacterium]|nr:FxDxF family PEP-CTERM protein [Burkholderiaceae bacterium]
MHSFRSALVVLSLTCAAGASQAQAPAVSKQTNLGSFATNSLSYGNSFSVSGGTVSSIGGNSFAQSATFYDTYTFTVPDVGYSSFTASLDLGTFFAIQGLQARLYSGSPLAAGTNLANNPSLVQKWSQSQTNPNPVATGSGTFNMINTGLSAGTYTLEVRGQVTGTAGGSYAGVINAAVVPEPSTYLLLALGLGLVAFQIRRQPR